MNYPFINNSSAVLPRSYKCDTLEGNWYEDRCISNFDSNKKKNYLLPNPNAWQYESTYNEIGKNWRTFNKINERFSESNDNIINFQEKDYNMYITTTKHSLDTKYKETFTRHVKYKDYYNNKKDELTTYRNTWTKREQSFETTYNNDILAKTGSRLVSSGKIN